MGRRSILWEGVDRSSGLIQDRSGIYLAHTRKRRRTRVRRLSPDRSLVLLRKNALIASNHHRLPAMARFELGEDIVDVVFDGSNFDHQPLGDLLIAVVSGQVGQHFTLALG